MLNKRSLRIGIVLLVIILFLTYSLVLRFNGINVYLYGDTIFHSERLLEIRYYLQKFEIPNWLNFYTFYGIGQSVNGMYPDITLWPLVAITNFLSPAHQIIAIETLIIILTLFISYLSLIKNHFDKETSFYCAVIYTFSGYCLYQFLNEMQLGTAIIMAFSFPIYFVTNELLNSKRLSLEVIFSFSLCITLILFSHLLSIVVYGFILLSIVIYKILLRRVNKYFFINGILSVPLVLITGSPIIYRILKISSSDVLPPFGRGHIKAATLSKMFNLFAWNSREQLSIVAIVLLLIIFTFFKINNEKTLVRLIFLELYIFILCLKIFPWKLFNKIPLINNLQYTPWRFGIWLSIIPIILFAIDFEDRLSLGRRISFDIAIISLIFSFSSLNYVMSGKIVKLSNSNITEIISSNPDSSSLKKNLIFSGEHPDYFPNKANVKNKHYTLRNSRINEIYNQKIDVWKENNLTNYKFNKQSSNNKVQYYFQSENVLKNVDIKVPFLCYKSLNYKVLLNGEKADYSSNKEGYLVLKNVNIDQYSEKISVSFILPWFYKLLVIISILTISLMCIILIINNRIKEG